MTSNPFCLAMFIENYLRRLSSLVSLMRIWKISNRSLFTPENFGCSIFLSNLSRSSSSGMFKQFIYAYYLSNSLLHFYFSSYKSNIALNYWNNSSLFLFFDSRSKVYYSNNSSFFM